MNKETTGNIYEYLWTRVPADICGEMRDWFVSLIQEEVNERDSQILSWFKIPIWATEEGKLGKMVCDTCGDSLIRIRGKYPKELPRDVCATCAIEILENLQASLYPNNQSAQVSL